MGHRRKSRECLLQLLFHLDVNNDQEPKVLVKNFWEEFPKSSDIAERAEELFLKIADKKDEIDSRIQKASKNWKVYRMSRIDRNVLRMATCELLYYRDIPAEVVIDEAIEVAKRFGAEDSSTFVNGVLDKIYKGIKE